jgi:hypothetical protein
MIFLADSIAADDNPGDDGLLAMRAALRDLKVVMRKPVEDARRADILNILSQARVMIDRINQKAT